MIVFASNVEINTKQSVCMYDYLFNILRLFKDIEQAL